MSQYLDMLEHTVEKKRTYLRIEKSYLFKYISSN